MVEAASARVGEGERRRVRLVFAALIIGAAARLARPDDRVDRVADGWDVDREPEIGALLDRLSRAFVSEIPAPPTAAGGGTAGARR